MTRPNRPTRLALASAAVGLAVGFATGRWWAASPAPGPADARPALTRVEEAVRRNDWQGGHDALLAALRVSPGSEEVFDAGCRFVEAADGGDGDAALHAQAILQRLDSAVPYLPLDRVPAARGRVSGLGDRLFRAGPQPRRPPGDSPFATVDELLGAAEAKDIPLGARVRLVQEAEGELSAICRRAAGGAGGEWKAYAQRKERHDRCQQELTRELFKASLLGSDRIDNWRKGVGEFIGRCDAPGHPEWKERDREAAQLLADGQRLLRDLVPYQDAGVPGAVALLAGGEIDREMRRVIRGRDWVYNRWTVAHIEHVGRAENLATPLDRLAALAIVEEERLVPYVSERFAAAWRQWFDRCESDADKLAATKYRILGGAR